jgi:inhibitor of cysteine peptidase
MAIRRAVEVPVMKLHAPALAGLLLTLAAAAAPLVTVNLSATATGQTVSIGVGQRLEVRLPANPTTGYQWTPALRGRAIAQTAAVVYQPQASGLLGAGGTDVFSYRGAAPGTAYLSFGYARSWERTAPAQRAALTVIVRAR